MLRRVNGTQFLELGSCKIDKISIFLNKRCIRTRYKTETIKERQMHPPHALIYAGTCMLPGCWRRMRKRRHLLAGVELWHAENKVKYTSTRLRGFSVDDGDVAAGGQHFLQRFSDFPFPDLVGTMYGWKGKRAGWNCFPEMQC